MKSYSLEKNFQFVALSKINLLSDAMQSSLSFHFSKIKRFDERINTFQNYTNQDFLMNNVALNSDFYGYIKNNRKQIESELDSLFDQYKKYKVQVNEISLDLKNSEKTNNKVVEKDGVICFNSSSKYEKDFLNQLEQLEHESENLLTKIELEQKQLFEKTDSLIERMRKQF
ncbi:hypothetical protein A7M79_00895 [Acinetobacter baumannii]|uniref:hypothetical protein n=1 Tax=Acinetobacter baumannii TaxID=470 RepID=UPI0008DE1CD7|nr:hypothetical protein [Acinetobacter baumannii]OIH12075.1 hypothetical protein A7M79_00895 [Acinetobacter baumannii]